MKKIIGYKLAKEEYYLAAVKIEGYTQTGEGNIKGRVFDKINHKDAIKKWKEAKVLDLWFEPVYEEFKFVAGKWYQITNPEGEYFVKVGCVGNYVLQHCESLTSTGCYINRSFKIERITKSELLTDLFVIQPWLPEGHPDKIPMYKVGVWYKGNRGKNTYYGKFLRSSKNYEFISSERFMFWGYSIDDYNFENGYDWVEATIEEIQFFLPDGHPEKTPTFQIGKWYRSDMGSAPKWYYLKVSKIDGKTIHGEGILTNGSYQESWFWDHPNSITQTLKLGPLTDLSEIQEFLLTGHVDKKIILEEGKYYYQQHPDWSYGYIFRYGSYVAVCTENVFLADWGDNGFVHVQREATSEEKQWLDACIDAHKFVSKEQALKTKWNNPKLNTLVEGEVYWSNNSAYPEGFIWKFKSVRHEGMINVENILHISRSSYGTNSCISNAGWENLRSAFPSEIQWLNVCIKQNTFVSQKEAYYHEKRWSTGTYVVSLEKNAVGINGFNVGCIALITSTDHIQFGNNDWLCSEQQESKYKVVKWFATVEEAKKFANTIMPPPKPKFKIGDKIFVYTLPFDKHWLRDTSQRVFTLTGNPTQYKGAMMWSTSGPGNCNEGAGYGIEESNFRLATPEEIKEYENNLLLDEAKKRYPVGTKFEPAHAQRKGEYCIVTNTNFSISESTIIALSNDSQRWVSEGNSIHGNTALNRVVYSKGKWAEILPSTPQITINGYKAEFHDEYVKFGCQEFTKDFILNLNRMLVAGKFIISDRDSINQIIEHYKK